MQRAIDEAKYVLAALYRTRNEVCANPTLFEPNALDRIDEAIGRTEHLLESAVSEATIQSVLQETKAA